MCNKGEDKEMATSTLFDTFVLNQEAAEMIASTPRKKLTEVNVFDDTKLSDKERVAHAASILEAWKRK
ncbi:hypothetical protein [Bacillus tuaregi]|uniref:hypothetical protein n=1 Tax=Bacillus tuaregi TaxID=1816695 RepID=UPI0008F93AB9|nr:hypothetical protein [Bacillus tuaregi]